MRICMLIINNVPDWCYRRASSHSTTFDVANKSVATNLWYAITITSTGICTSYG